MRWTCPVIAAPNNNYISMSISILFLVLAISVAHAVIRPLMQPQGEVERKASVRRHQATDQIASNLADVVPRAQPPPKFLDSNEALLQTVKKPTKLWSTTKTPLTPQQTIDDFDEARKKRIEARWRRLGINLRAIQYPVRRTSNEKSLELVAVKNRPVSKKSSTEKNTDEFFFKKDDIHVMATQNTRKTAPALPTDKDVTPRRPRILGPLLGTPTKDGDARESGYGLKLGNRPWIAAPTSSSPETHEEVKEVLPRFTSPVATPAPNSDYHSRTTPVFKSYKYSQKLGQRPRLRIRRPGEKSVSENSIQEDPNLTPFQNSARARFGYGSRGGATGSIPRYRSVQASVRTIEISSTTEAVTRPPIANTSEAITTPRTTTIEATVASKTADVDSGIGVEKSPSELPPELSNVGFGFGGNGINFNVAGPGTPPEPKEKAKRPKQRKQPNPDIFKEEGEPLVIPQNSGLRPVAPPKEFLDGGGFGSGSGNSGFGESSSFGSGSYEGNKEGGGTSARTGGSAGIGTGISAGTASETASDLFTGDSALTPSLGPTGDGYGPPIFPGGAIPPPVPAVGLGGAAAGKSPYAAVMEPTENPPTTVKPSALLNVLNRADQGINQAISHFEQRSPLETAAIDILEVALGSQKLDSQAKLLGHVDRAIGLDNLQRIQRWANTAGAMDVFKEEMVKFMKNFEPPEDVLPSLPPQLEYLFKPSGR